jgi:hypothetical protein
VRDALARLRKALEKRLALESTQAARITVTGHKSVGELLTAMEAQSTNRIALAADVAPPEGLAVDWRGVPFWNSVDAIGRARGWQPRWSTLNNRWELAPVKESERDLASVVSGPFRVAVRIVTWKTLPDSTQRLLRASLVVQAESRLRPLFLAVSPGDWSGRMGATQLSAWNPTAEYELSFGDHGREVEWTLDLVAPTADTKTEPWSLTGKANVHLAAGTEPFVFDATRLSRGATQRRGDVTVRLKPALFETGAEGKRDVTVRMVLSYAQGGPAFESHRVGMFHRTARLETTDGTTVPFHKFEVVTEADGGVALEFHFTGLMSAPANYRFLYDAPTLLLDVPVQVEFARIEAPQPSAR